MIAQTQLDILNLLLLRGSVTIEDIAAYEGLSPKTLHNAGYRWVLPAYGDCIYRHHKRWNLVEYLAWRQIPQSRRRDALNYRGNNRLPNPNDVRAEWKEQTKQFSLRELFAEFYGKEDETTSRTCNAKNRRYRCFFHTQRFIHHENP